MNTEHKHLAVIAKNGLVTVVLDGTVSLTPDEATGWAFRLSKSAEEARSERQGAVCCQQHRSHIL